MGDIISTSWKRIAGALSVIFAVIVVAGIAYVTSPRSESLDVTFLHYTNSPSGELSATLEIRNRSKECIVRNSCRISPEPADAGYWHAADVRSHRLEPDATERLVVTFEPRPMTRWRATILYVRNPTAIEFRLMNCVDWLRGHGWVPSALRKWRDEVAGGQASTDAIPVPATNGPPIQSLETNRHPVSPREARAQPDGASYVPKFPSAAAAHRGRPTPGKKREHEL